MSEQNDKTPEQVSDEDYKVAPTSGDRRKILNKTSSENNNNNNSGREQAVEENHQLPSIKEQEEGHTRIKAYDADDSYNEIVSGHKAIEAFATRQETCKVCGLTARNKEELQDHIRSAH
jgi:DNA repair exonuclease SbcCD ATPase subunit